METREFQSKSLGKCIILKNHDRDYLLYAIEQEYNPFIVVNEISFDIGEWVHGSYFEDLDSSLEKFNERTNLDEKIAIKSGYYFLLFDRKKVYFADRLVPTSYKVNFENKNYDILGADTIEDEKIINNLFGEELGNEIDEYLIEEPEIEKE